MSQTVRGWTEDYGSVNQLYFRPTFRIGNLLNISHLIISLSKVLGMCIEQNQKMNAKPSPAQQNNALLITINETTAVNAKNKTQSDFCFRSARFPSGEDHYSVRRGNAPEPRLPTNLPQEYCVGLETSGDQQYEDPAHLRWAVWSGGPRRWHMQVRICLTIAMVTYWLIATVILKFLS